MEQHADDMKDYSIFIESSEVMGLIYKNYKHLPDIIKAFMSNINDKIKILISEPDSEVIDLSKDIRKFKEDIDIKGKPEEIYKDEIPMYKKDLKQIRSSIDDILSTLVKSKNKIAFGGNYFRAIIRKPKVYSKDIDSDKYEIINNNIRNINRAFDWVEKIVIDLYNLVDQDSNILTIIERIYLKKGIYESNTNKPAQGIKYMTENMNDEDANIISENFNYIECFIYTLESADSDVSYIHESDDNTDQQDPDQKPEPKESLPKQIDSKERNANGVKRKQLYIEFIKYAKTIHSNNLFGSIFDKNAFDLYNFVPHEMRYFYRLANPLLCVLNDSLTFFALSELKKINVENKEINKLLIFAADKSNKLIIFNNQDKKVYDGENKDKKIVCNNELSGSFDTYLESLIGTKILGESFIDDIYE